MNERSLFMTQVALPLSRQAGYPQHFIDLIRSFPPRGTPSEKSQFYSYLAGKLIAGLPWMDRGVWEFFGNTEEALSQFADWADDTLEMKEARKVPLPVGPSDDYRGGDEKRFVVVCAVFLMDGTSGSSQHIERTLGAIPQDRLWHKSTFDTVFRLFYSLNFATVASDSVFVLPGDEQYALTEQDLAHDNYSFFRPMVNG